MLIYSIVISLVVASSALQRCGVEWINYGNSCYHISHDSESWPDAVTVCNIIGGWLVEINTAEEGKFLSSIAVRNQKVYWIGGNDFLTEGKWVWVDTKQPLNQSGYSHWYPGEPENRNHDENCVAIWWHGYWADDHCGKEKQYICETEATGDISGPVIG